MLKCWIETLPVLSAFAITSSDPLGHTLVQHGEDLMPVQQQELNELVDQFKDVLSGELGRTHVILHDIKTPLRQ